MTKREGETKKGENNLLVVSTPYSQMVYTPFVLHLISLSIIYFPRQLSSTITQINHLGELFKMRRSKKEEVGITKEDGSHNFAPS